MYLTFFFFFFKQQTAYEIASIPSIRSARRTTTDVCARSNGDLRSADRLKRRIVDDHAVTRDTGAGVDKHVAAKGWACYVNKASSACVDVHAIRPWVGYGGSKAPVSVSMSVCRRHKYAR